MRASKNGTIYRSLSSIHQTADFISRLDAIQQERLSDFLNVQPDDLNRSQRILLVAEAYDYEVLVSAEWLHDNYGLDVLCTRVGLAKDARSGAEYLSCSIVFPAPELAGQAVPRRRQGAGSSDAWRDWDSALAPVVVPEIVTFYRNELAAKVEWSLNDRTLIYRSDGSRRWFLSARNNRCYCWQEGRFEGDVDFWSKRLSHPETIKPVRDESALRFSVYTGDDLTRFAKAVRQELLGVEWTDDAQGEPEGQGEDLVNSANAG